MDLFDFLDTNETRQLIILDGLLQVFPKKYELKEFRKRLTLPSSTVLSLAKQLEEKMQIIHPDVRILITEEEKNTYFYLKSPDNFNFSELYSHYLTESINFKILHFILNQQKVVISNLVNRFYLSESSIFRKLKALNHVLEEFNIQIKHGKLLGPESQIRYFYYNMILNSHSMNYFLNDQTNYLTNIFVNVLENIYGYTFTESGKVKLGIWLGISLKRLPLSHKNLSTISFHSKIGGNPLFNAIKNAMLATFNQYAIHIDQYEIYQIYYFICSMELFSLEEKDSVSLKKYLDDPVKTSQKVNDLFFKTIHQIYPDLDSVLETHLKHTISYVITQLHNKVTYFRGSFYFFHGDSISKIYQDKTYDTVRKIAKEQTNTTLSYLHLLHYPGMEKIIYRRYFNIILHIHVRCSDKLNIGVALHSDWSIVTGIIHRLKHSFSALYHSMVEEAKPAVYYDLLITDSTQNLTLFTFRQFYFLHELETNYDLEKIKQLLDALYKEKYK